MGETNVMATMSVRVEEAYTIRWRSAAKPLREFAPELEVVILRDRERGSLELQPGPISTSPPAPMPKFGHAVLPSSEDGEGCHKVVVSGYFGLTLEDDVLTRLVTSGAQVGYRLAFKRGDEAALAGEDYDVLRAPPTTLGLVAKKR